MQIHTTVSGISLDNFSVSENRGGSSPILLFLYWQVKALGSGTSNAGPSNHCIPW